MSNRRYKYAQALKSYGFLTLLLLLKEYEEAENFEECQDIYVVLVEANRIFKFNMPTRYSEEALEHFRTEMNRLGYAGDTMVHNLPNYVEMVKELIDS